MRRKLFVSFAVAFALVAFLGICLAVATAEVPPKPVKPEPIGRGVPVLDEGRAEPPAKGYRLTSVANVGGLWVSRDSERKTPFAAFYSQSDAGLSDAAILGFTKNQKGDPHDFAIVATDKEVYFQIRDKKGNIHFVPVEALTKLKAE